VNEYPFMYRHAIQDVKEKCSASITVSKYCLKRAYIPVLSEYHIFIISIGSGFMYRHAIQDVKEKCSASITVSKYCLKRAYIPVLSEYHIFIISIGSGFQNRF
jgi:uncharacterized secreted protein with C-terminal beta-propeller domain